MKIDRHLNLVQTVDQGGGELLYIHSIPIARETFERYYLVIARSFAALYKNGLDFMAGPKVAMYVLRDTAKELGTWEGPGGVEQGLVAEMRRLSNVLLPGPTGWVTVPFQEALDKNMLSPDDAAEVESAIAFFICNCAMHKRSTLLQILDGMVGLWGAQTTLSNSTEYARSLPTSTGTDSSGTTAPTSSVLF